MSVNEEEQYDQAKDVFHKASQAAYVFRNTSIGALPVSVQLCVEDLFRGFARAMVETNEIIARPCDECGKKTNVDLACDCFQTVAAE